MTSPPTSSCAVVPTLTLATLPAAKAVATAATTTRTVVGAATTAATAEEAATTTATTTGDRRPTGAARATLVFSSRPYRPCPH